LDGGVPTRTEDRVAIACAVSAAAAFTWIYINLRGGQSKGPDLVRLSPDDGFSYSHPAISPDGGFVATSQTAPQAQARR